MLRSGICEACINLLAAAHTPDLLRVLPAMILSSLTSINWLRGKLLRVPAALTTIVRMTHYTLSDDDANDDAGADSRPPELSAAAPQPTPAIAGRFDTALPLMLLSAATPLSPRAAGAQRAVDAPRQAAVTLVCSLAVDSSGPARQMLLQAGALAGLRQLLGADAAAVPVATKSALQPATPGAFFFCCWWRLVADAARSGQQSQRALCQSTVWRACAVRRLFV